MSFSFFLWGITSDYSWFNIESTSTSNINVINFLHDLFCFVFRYFYASTPNCLFSTSPLTPGWKYPFKIYGVSSLGLSLHSIPPMRRIRVLHKDKKRRSDERSACKKEERTRRRTLFNKKTGEELLYTGAQKKTAFFAIRNGHVTS